MEPKSETVRALTRGLAVLRHLNQEGADRASEIARALSLPRPTVYRLLHTLEEAGYVAFSGSDARVRITPLAASLGDNSAARSKLCQIATPVIARFTAEHSWPIDISIFQDMHMVVQETTHGKSALSIDQNMPGYPLPILRSSAGRAYLAHCPDAERGFILAHLNEENLVEDTHFLRQEWLDENLRLFRKQGFAIRDPRTFRPKTASIAVPIFVGERLVGCLSMIWIAKAMRMAHATGRYVKPLKDAAAEIGGRFAATETAHE